MPCVTRSLSPCSHPGHLLHLVVQFASPNCNLVSYVERAPRHFPFEVTKQKGRRFDCFKSAL